MIGQDGPPGPAQSEGLPDASSAASEPGDVEVRHGITSGVDHPSRAGPVTD